MRENLAWGNEELESMALQFFGSVRHLHNNENLAISEDLSVEAMAFCELMRMLMEQSDGITSPSEKRYISSAFTSAADAIQGKAQRFDLPTQHPINICIRNLRDHAQILCM